MKKVFYCIVFVLLLLCSYRNYHYNDNQSLFLTIGKEKYISEVSPLPRNIGPKRDNHFGEALEKTSEEVMFKADSILYNKYPQFCEKGED